MAFCSVCQLAEANHTCEECSGPVCAHCTAQCQVCSKRICRTHVQVTSRGRRLCGACMKRRNAKRKAMLEERKAQQEGRKPSTATPAGTGFSALMGDEAPSPPRKPAGGMPGPKPAGSGTSFAELMGDVDEAPPSPAKRRAAIAPVEEDLNAPRPDDEEFEHEPKKEVHISESLQNADMQDPERKARLKAAMGVGVPEPGASRLDLGPIDENRPILTSSGYQPPAWWKYLLAYVAFTVALLWVLNSSKQFQELLMPWDAPEFNFTEGQMPTIQDTNALRNTSNVTQFEFFSQGPFFFIAWAFVLVFAFGGVYIVWGTLSSFYWSYRTWRSERKARKHDPNENVHARMDRLG